MTPDPSPKTAELAYLGLDDLRSALSSGQLTSSELVVTLLRRIEDVDTPGSPTALRSVLAVSDDARQDALASDERRRNGGSIGVLEGIPVLIKDSIETIGLPSCAGSTSLLGRPPSKDAPLVARIRAAGAIVLGTTNPQRVIDSAAGSDIPLTRPEWYRLFTTAGHTLP